MSKKNIILGLLFLAILYLSGCAASGPKFSGIDSSPENLSEIYLYRPSAFASGGVGFPIIHNGEQLPYLLHNQGYLQYLAEAGHHKIYVNLKGVLDNPLEFDSKPGQIYFVRVSSKTYLAFNGTDLALVDKDIALDEIKNCKLSTTGNSLKPAIQEQVPTMGNIAKAIKNEERNDTFVADEIRKLNDLKNEGIITEEEFKDKKSKLLQL